MLSTRFKVATRQLAADNNGAPQQRGSRGHKCSLQIAQRTSTQSLAVTRRQAGGAEKLTNLQAARGASATNRSANNSISESHTAAGRQGNASRQHHLQRKGIDATAMI